jgi:hypothetical protein
VLQAKFFRSLILNIFLFLGVITAHHLADGYIGNLNGIGILFLFSTIGFWIKPISEFEGPNFAALLVISQLLGHFTLQENLSISTNQMLSSHAIAILVTYKLAHKLDYFAKNSYQLLVNLLLPKITRFFIKFNKISLIVITTSAKGFTRYHSSNNFGRAPPDKFALINY